VQKYYSTGKELSPEEWDKLSRSKTAELSKVRNSIRNSYELVLLNVEKLISLPTGIEPVEK
jgi:predicted DNA-binding protein (MmcQ/YjbR family)